MGSAFTLIATVLNHWLGSKSIRDSEARAAQRQREQEERATRRELRRERVAPLLTYAAATSGYVTQTQMNTVMTGTIERVEAGVEEFARTSGQNPELIKRHFDTEVQQWRDEQPGDLAEFFRVMRMTFDAAQAAPSSEILSATMKVWESMGSVRGQSRDAVEANRELTKLLEAYIVQVD